MYQSKHVCLNKENIRLSKTVNYLMDGCFGMTPNEAYGESRINTDCDDSKTAEEQDNYDYVLNI